MEIVRCAACDGYGWTEDDEDGAAVECIWCAGVGYVMRGDDGIDRPIPAADLGRYTAQLEALERERLREMGYTGDAKHPNEQAIRKEPNAEIGRDAEEHRESKQ